VDNVGALLTVSDETTSAATRLLSTDQSQGLWGCPGDCTTTRHHDHVLQGDTELTVCSVTDEILEIRHATAWASTAL
jgi:hypothetical protein